MDHLATEPASAVIGQPATESDATFEWCIVEIFGHRKHAGRGREEERFGSKMLRIDVPKFVSFRRTDPNAAGVKLDPPEIEWVTHYYGGASIFSFTLTDESTVMQMNKPWEPPARYSLPSPGTPDDRAEEDDNDLPFEEELELDE